MDGLTRGIEHFNAGRFEAALRCFRQARAGGSDDARLRMFVAHALNSLGRRAEAVAEFSALIDARPGHLPAYAGLAALVLQDTAAAADAAALKKLLLVEPGEGVSSDELADALRTCARAQSAVGDLPEAERTLERALSVRPRDEEGRLAYLEVRRLREQALLAAGDLAGAAALLRDGLTRPLLRDASRLSLVDVLHRQASELATAGRNEDAARVLREALALAPRNPRTRGRLAMVLDALAAPATKDLVQEERSLREALARSPRDEDLRRRLVALLEERAARGPKAPAAGEKTVRGALGLRRGRAPSRSGAAAGGLGEGVEHFNAGRFEDALRCFRAARAAGDRGPQLRVFIGHVLASLGRKTEALAEFAALIRAAPRHLPAYAGLAALVLQGEAPAGAAAPLRRALALTPRGPEERRALIESLRVNAQALRSTGDLKGAEDALKRALDLRPADARSRRLFVDIRRMREQACLAADDLERAQALLREGLRIPLIRDSSRRALVDVLHRRARDRVAARRFDDAVRFLREALTLAPKDERTRRRLVAVLGMQASQSERSAALAEPAPAASGPGAAERALREALRLAPDDARSRRGLIAQLHRRAGVLIAARNYDAAVRALNEALELDPERAQTRRRLVTVLGLQASRAVNAAGAAERLLRDALKLSPGDAATRRRLTRLIRRRALSSLRAGRIAPALTALRQAMAVEPKDGKCLRLLEQIKALKARERRAREVAARLKRAEEVRLAFESLRACAQGFKPDERLRHAGERFKRVLRLAPRHAPAHAVMGGILFCTGEIRRGRALLARALRLDRGALTAAERYMVLMKLGRYKDALRTGERILDGKPGLDELRAFWDPWEWDERRPREERLAELAALTRAVGEGAYAPWLAYYQADLGGPEDLARFERLAEYPRRRYGWMFAKAGLAALCAGRYDRAAKWFEGGLQCKPADWRSRAFLAETYLCLHRPAAAAAQMRRAARMAPEEERPQVLAWQGELELWSGRYRRAHDILAEAARLGAPYALSWLGAALLKLGKPARALKQLDHALSLYPLDYEAYVWRGEAKRELGLHREALKDLNDAVTPVGMWARFNRALVKQALGDEAGMKADFDAIPGYVLAYVRKKAGVAPDGPLKPSAMRKVLLTGLRLSRGFRREEYRQAVWMK